MTVPNIPALEATYARIVERPDEWNQGDWLCNTGMCFAGHAAMLEGATLPPVLSMSWTVDPETGEYRRWEPSNGAVHVSDFARQRLGLTELQASELFAGGNDLSRIRRIIDAIAADPDYSPYEDIDEDDCGCCCCTGECSAEDEDDEEVPA